MLRQGLDPDRVDWLALTDGPVEHMQQYANIDIALDPIPNGGCTTTCEALVDGCTHYYYGRDSLCKSNEYGCSCRCKYVRMDCSRSLWLYHLAIENMPLVFRSCVLIVINGVVNFRTAL